MTGGWWLVEVMSAEEEAGEREERCMPGTERKISSCFLEACGKVHCLPGTLEAWENLPSLLFFSILLRIGLVFPALLEEEDERGGAGVEAFIHDPLLFLFLLLFFDLD